MTSCIQKWKMICGSCIFVICTALSSPPANAMDNEKSTRPHAPAKEAQGQPSERKIADEIEALQGEMKERPTDSAAIRLGHLLLGKGALYEALQSFDEALRLNPRSFEAKVGKGVVLGRQGKLEAAEQLLRDALVLNPNPVRVHYELGMLYEKQSEFFKAIAEYKEGIKKYQEGKK